MKKKEKERTKENNEKTQKGNGNEKRGKSKQKEEDGKASRAEIEDNKMIEKKEREGERKSMKKKRKAKFGIEQLKSQFLRQLKDKFYSYIYCDSKLQTRQNLSIKK